MMKLVVAMAFLIATTFGPLRSAQADSHEVAEHTVTPSYSVGLEVGPVSPMLTVENAAGEPMVEVMVPDSAGAVALRAVLDQDVPVNRHLEIYLSDARTGRVVLDQPPIIQILNQSSGQERTLALVAPMFDEADGMSDWHYGNNLYLPDGLYTITATMNGERAAFNNVVLTSDD